MSSGAIHGYGAESNATFKAGDAITIYDAVYLSDVNTMSVNASTTANLGGIAQEAQATTGSPVTVRMAGFSLGVSSGGWTIGDKLTGNTGGTLLTTTTAANTVVAIACDTVSTTEYGEVFIISPAIRYDSF